MAQLWRPVAIMIWIAVVIESCIENWHDIPILLAIQFVNAGFSYNEIIKDSFLMFGTVKRDGKWSFIDSRLIVPGDLLLLTTGSTIPADCLVNEGSIVVNQAELTGDSSPVIMYKGSCCKMGSHVIRGTVEATVQYTGVNTLVGKTSSSLPTTDAKETLQKVLYKIVIVFVLLSLTFSCVSFGYLLTCGSGINETMSITVTLIIVSIPFGLEIACTTTLAIGAKELSKHGAIVTHLAAIEDMASMTMLCSDMDGVNEPKEKHVVKLV
jgi:H+-transporting ATPase